MRHSVSIIALGVAFATCHIVKVEAGFRKTAHEEDMVKKISQARALKNGHEEIKKFKTGSVRTSRFLTKADGSEIIQCQTKHRDGTVTYFLSGIKFEDIPIPPVHAWVIRANELNKAKAGGFKEYAESQYGPPLRSWAKLERVRPFKKAQPVAVNLKVLTDYLGTRHEKIKEQFPPEPVWIGKKTKGKTLLLDLDDITYSSSSEGYDSDMEDDYGDYKLPTYYDL